MIKEKEYTNIIKSNSKNTLISKIKTGEKIISYILIGGVNHD